MNVIVVDTFDELKYNVVRNNEGFFYYNSDGLLHRDNDQPAIIYPDGINEWWMNGERYLPKEEFKRRAGLSGEQMAFLLLRYNFK